MESEQVVFLTTDEDGAFTITIKPDAVRDDTGVWTIPVMSELDGAQVNRANVMYDRRISDGAIIFSFELIDLE